MNIPKADPLPQWAVDKWGVPTLLLDLQGKSLTIPAIKYGTFSRLLRARTTVHFYTDDYKFGSLWDNPEKIINADPPSVIEVNYSTRPEMSRAEALYFIWRKRWLSRLWQDFDIPIFVDLNVEECFFDLALMGVPPGWTAYANRAKSKDPDHLFRAYDLAKRHAKIVNGGVPVYVVYGGGESIRQVCNDRGWVWLPEDSEQVRRGKNG